MCDMESTMIGCSGYALYNTYPSKFLFDRYMLDTGAQEIFAYAKLIVKDGITIGYVLAYLAHPEETRYALRLLPQYAELYGTVISGVEGMFPEKSMYRVIANSLEPSLCEALIEGGYENTGEERWQAGMDLREYTETNVMWTDEVVNFLSGADIDDRVEHAEIPTGKPATRAMYEAMMSGPYYKYALDYVVRSAADNKFMGYITWWIDEKSNTATLEPVACLPEFRRRGIMKRALFHGLNELKRRGMNYAYVSTSIRNEASRSLYGLAGFRKIGTACRYVKEKQPI